MTDETKKRFQEHLSDVRVWVMIAYFLLVWVAVALDLDYSRSSRAIAKAEALAIQKQAEDSSASAARVNSCLVSIPTLNKFNAFVDAVLVFHQVSAQNAKALLNETPPSSPEYQVRRRNYERIAGTLPAISAIRFPVPTKAKCESKRTTR